MAFWSNWFKDRKSSGPQPRASYQDTGGIVIDSPERLEEALRSGSLTASGAMVTPNTAMRVATVYACVRIMPSDPATATVRRS